jgi:hypothetical protein
LAKVRGKGKGGGQKLNLWQKIDKGESKCQDKDKDEDKGTGNDKGNDKGKDKP